MTAESEITLKRGRLVGRAFRHLLKTQEGGWFPSIYGMHNSLAASRAFPAQYEANVLCIQCNTFKKDKTAEAAHAENVNKVTEQLDALGIPYRILGADSAKFDADQDFLKKIAHPDGMLIAPTDAYPYHIEEGRNSCIVIDLGDNPEAVLDKFRPAYNAQLRSDLEGASASVLLSSASDFMGASRIRALGDLAEHIELGGDEAKTIIGHYLGRVRDAAAANIENIATKELGLRPLPARSSGRGRGGE